MLGSAACVTRVGALAAALVVVGACAGQRGADPGATSRSLPTGPAHQLSDTSSDSLPGGASDSRSQDDERRDAGAGRGVRLFLAGDVMLGRGMTAVVAGDPDGVFADVRHLVAAADVAAANLESPLTLRAHVSRNENALEADPVAAGVIARAGFDVLSVANNHAGDAGPSSVLDTVAAVEGAGMSVVGGGSDRDAAARAVYLERSGVRVAFLAFDATRGGLEAGSDTPGVVHWDHARAHTAVSAARADADVVVVSLHGGVEYLADTDPGQRRLAETLASWGVDVVWGHGPHVLQPVTTIRRAGGGSTVVATSLGNLVFDQQRAMTTRGGLLEIIADTDGVVAYRVGTSDNADRRVHLDHWELPAGDAALLGNDWWTPLRGLGSSRIGTTSPEPSATDLSAWTDFEGDVIDARVGDATGDGRRDVVVSFRRAYRPTLISRQFPDREWADTQGRAAHLGVYDPSGRPEWVAGTMFRPVAHMAVCDGALALAFDQLDDPEIVATGAWRWEGFGFTVPVELPGPGEPRCTDVDGDGHLDPYLDRSAP